jgi:hypothetical protein
MTIALDYIQPPAEYALCKNVQFEFDSLVSLINTEISGLSSIYAPIAATYVTLSTNSSLTNERVLTGTTNQISIADNGAGSTVVLSTPQDIATTSSPTFEQLTLSSSAPSLNVTSSSTNSTSTVFRSNSGTRISIVGQEGSGGGDIFSGSSAYACVIGTTSSAAFEIFTADTKRLSISSSGISTFSGQVVIEPTTNQIVLGSTRTVTLTAPTPASSSRTWTIPDLSTNPTFAALEATQTFSGVKTFSAQMLSTTTTAPFLSHSSSLSGATQGMNITNSSTSSGSGVQVYLEVQSASGADPSIYFNVASGNPWTIGVDNDDSDIFKISQSGGALVTNPYLNITTGGDLYTTAFTDYSSTSTVTGWTSFTSKKIFYKKIGKLIFVTFELTGTSNATTASFTLPNSVNTSVGVQIINFAKDNSGTPVAGTAFMDPNTATVVFIPTVGGSSSGWTNSGTKSVIGQLSYQTT